MLLNMVALTRALEKAACDGRADSAALRRCALALLLCAAAAGCRIAGAEGPVSRSVVTSRQLAQRGVTAIERGDWKTAEELLEEAVRACPVDANSRRLYAEVLWQQGHRDEALEHIDEAVRLSGDDASYLTRAGEMRLATGDLEPGIELAQRAIDASPRMPAAWLLRGRLMKQAGDSRAAMADFHRALAFNPEDRDALLELADTYRGLGEPHRAVTNLQSLADTYPPGEEPQDVLYLLGCTYLAMGRHEDALASLSTARQRGPASAELMCRLGEAELLAGRSGQAQSLFQQALAIDPQHAESHSRLAQVVAAQADVALK